MSRRFVALGLVLLAACGNARDASTPPARAAPPSARPAIDSTPDAVIVDAIPATPVTLDRARGMLGTAQTVATLEASVADYSFRDRYGSIIGHRDDNPAPDFVDVDFVIAGTPPVVVRVDIGTPTIPSARGIRVGQTFKDLRTISGLECEGRLEADVSQTDCKDPSDGVTYTLEKFYKAGKIPNDARIKAFSLVGGQALP